jgi:type I restriction enzyme R subunit
MPNHLAVSGINGTRLSTLRLLLAMGWKYVAPDDCLARRGGSKEVIMQDSLLGFWRTRRFDCMQQSHAFSSTALAGGLLALQGLKNWPSDNHALYLMLKNGVAVTELLPNQQAQSLSLPLLDWHHPRANLFEVSERFTLPEQAGEIDLVCFVNGIPLCAIQAGDHAPESGLRQHLQWQQQARLPGLYLFAQLLLAVGGIDARYAGILASEKFWTRWVEEDMPEATLLRFKRSIPPAETVQALLAALPPQARLAARRQLEFDSTDLGVTYRDQLLCGLLLPERLLEYLDWAVVREQRSSKRVARSHQFFAVRALLARLSQHLPGDTAGQLGPRAGGVLWHATGSGKSLTMIFLLQALQRDPVLRDCRVIVVTDRLDLQDQLASSFLKHGVFSERSAYGLARDTTLRARSGRDLARMIGDNDGNNIGNKLMFAMLHKFNGALMQEACRNPGDKIIVLVDEAHRSHGGELHARMRRVLKRAAFVGFTGTPLLKQEKTRALFGPILHRYTMQRALNEQMVTPLLYEERQVQLALDQSRLQRWFARSGLNAQQQAQALRALATKTTLQSACERIEKIAWDIALHFNIVIKQTGCGLKGIVAASSKQDAVRYHHYLNQTGLVSSAVLISAPEQGDDVLPDRAEMADAADGPPGVSSWWQRHVGKQQSGYEARCLKQYAETNQLDLLIVVDRFLTGFDQPRAAVLYIDKPLQQHGLMQAIARVNRLHEAKRFGLLVDYRHNLRALDTALHAYGALEQAQDYDAADLQDLYQTQQAQIARLPQLLHALQQCIPPGTQDSLERYRQALLAKCAPADDRGKAPDGGCEAFFESLAAFSACLRLAWCASGRADSQDQNGDHEQGLEQTLEYYQRRLDFFTGLAQLVRHDLEKRQSGFAPPLHLADGHGTIQVGRWPIQHLADRMVQALEVNQVRSQYLVPGGSASPLPPHWSAEQIRSEADLIRARITKRIEVDLDDDPYAQQMLGQQLQKSLDSLNAAEPEAGYRTLQHLELIVARREVEGMPPQLAGQRIASTCYGVFILTLGSGFLASLAPEKQAELLELAQWVQQEARNLHLAAADVERNVSQHLNIELFRLLGSASALQISRRIVQLLGGFLQGNSLQGNSLQGN